MPPPHRWVRERRIPFRGRYSMNKPPLGSPWSFVGIGRIRITGGDRSLLCREVHHWSRWPRGDPPERRRPARPDRCPPAARPSRSLASGGMEYPAHRRPLPRGNLECVASFLALPQPLLCHTPQLCLDALPHWVSGPVGSALRSESSADTLRHAVVRCPEATGSLHRR